MKILYLSIIVMVILSSILPFTFASSLPFVSQFASLQKISASALFMKTNSTGKIYAHASFLVSSNKGGFHTPAVFRGLNDQVTINSNIIISKVITINNSNSSVPESPLQQFKSGVEVQDVKCNEGFARVIKTSDNSPACVMPHSVSALYERGLIFEQPGIPEIIIPSDASNPVLHKNSTPLNMKIDNGRNDTVMWINLDHVSHTVVVASMDVQSLVNVITIPPNQTRTFTFLNPSSNYYNSPGVPWINGTIDVYVDHVFSPVPDNVTTLTLTTGQVMGPIVIKSINRDNVTGIYFRGFDNYANTFSLQVGKNFTTYRCDGISVKLEKISDQKAIFSVYNHNTEGMCPICLSANTLIGTPNGNRDVKELKAGMSVWTLDNTGHKESATIIKTSKKVISSDAILVQVILNDGRKLLASPAHPTTDGRFLGELKVGDTLDNAKIKNIELVSYGENYTYDVLPSGPTGFYWANGILVGSTLK